MLTFDIFNIAENHHYTIAGVIQAQRKIMICQRDNIMTLGRMKFEDNKQFHSNHLTMQSLLIIVMSLVMQIFFTYYDTANHNL